MGGDKGGGASKRYSYYGTIAGAVCSGPVDSILAVIADGKEIWSGTANRSGDAYADLTSGIPSKWFTSGGYFRFYFGTSGQAADGALGGHPAYRGVAYFVAKNFLFGKEKSLAPNVEIIVQRKPVISTSIVEAGDNTLLDGQVNPVAALAELLTSDHGAGIPLTRLDPASWKAAGTFAASDRPRYFCSPLVASARDLRQSAAELLAMFDGVLTWTAAGTLAVRLLKPGVDPGELVTLDANAFTDDPAFQFGSWGDVPTSVVTVYADRERSFKQADEKVDNLVALGLRGEPQTLSVDLPHVTRRAQAALLATEIVRRSFQPVTRVTVEVRPEVITGLGPGDKVRVDVDGEPGGDGLAQVAVIEDRRDTPGKPSKLVLACDALVAAVPYSPTYDPWTSGENFVPDIAHARVVPLPTTEWETPSVAVLATRPAVTVTGMRVFFDTNTDTGAFADLGRQDGFACRLTIDADFDDAERELDLTLTDGASGVDAYLAGELPETEIDAKADKVLLVLLNVDGNGRVVIGADGFPESEICSVVSRVAVDSDSHTYTVFRARRGTTARAWTTSAEAWLLPLSNVAAWTHPDIEKMLTTGDVGYIRLLATGGGVEALDTFERSFVMAAGYNRRPVIEWTTPSGQVGTTDASGDITVDLDVTDSQADLISLRIDSEATDGTGDVNHANLSFAPVGSRNYSATLNFAVGSYLLTATATDAEGHVTRSQRTIQNTTGGSNPVATFDPESGETFFPTMVVTITVYAPSDRLQYVIGAPGSSAPTGDGALVLATTKDLVMSATKRLWARAGDGSTWSAWVSADYELDV